MKGFLKMLPHFVGLGIMATGVVFVAFVFYAILFQGYVKFAEPNIVILMFEVALGSYGVLYLLYVFKKLLRVAK